jgi:hypothetical protein
MAGTRKSTIVLPAGSRPSGETTLGHHEARVRAIERQRPPAADLPIAVFKFLGALPITLTSGVTQVGIGFDTVEANLPGQDFFSIDGGGGVIQPGFYHLSLWLQHDAAIDWGTDANTFYSPIVSLGAVISSGDAFGLYFEMITTTPGLPTLFQVKSEQQVNIPTVDTQLNMLYTVPLDTGVALPSQISYPPHMVAVRLGDYFTATPGP